MHLFWWSFFWRLHFHGCREEYLQSCCCYITASGKQNATSRGSFRKANLIQIRNKTWVKHVHHVYIYIDQRERDIYLETLVVAELAGVSYCYFTDEHLERNLANLLYPNQNLKHQRTKCHNPPWTLTFNHMSHAFVLSMCPSSKVMWANDLSANSNGQSTLVTLVALTMAWSHCIPPIVANNHHISPYSCQTDSGL